MDGSADSARHRSRLSTTTRTSSDRLHPLFAFKRDLIRLIANLSHESTIVQDIVNEVGAFPLILNQCSIDHQNPCILLRNSVTIVVFVNCTYGRELTLYALNLVLCLFV